jgi:diguanylate cyclase (GGDEF)-like protein/PAS domain S-box-containing protein
LGASAAAVLVVVGLACTTWKLAHDANEGARRVAHTHAVIERLARARADTLQVEFSTQSYRISGDPSHIAERDAANASRENLLDRLHGLLADNAVQQERLLRLREVIAQRFAISRQVEALRRTQGQAAANAFVATAPLQETRERTYRLLQQIDEAERLLLAQRSAEQLRAQEIMVSAGAGVTFLLLMLLGATYGLIRRQLRQTEAGRLALAQSEERLSTTLDSIGDGVLATDTQGRVTRMNPVSEALTGWSLREAQGRPIEEVFQIVNETTRESAVIPVAKVLETGEVQELANDTVLIARNGGERAIADSAAPIRDAMGRVHGVVLVFRDVTASHQAQQTIREQSELLEQRVHERTEQLRQSEQRLSRVLEGSDQGYWDWNLKTDRFQVSARWETMLGYAPGQMQVGTEQWPKLVHPDDWPVAMVSIERHLQGRSPSHEVEFRVKTKDEGWRWILTRGRIVTWAEDGTPLMMSGTHTDVTQIKAHQAELDRVANYDSLTELPNRRLLADRLQQAILRSDRSGKLCVVGLLDLDGFKAINDQFGHEVGDQLLKGVAQNLQAVLRVDDTLSRLGGDEFVLLLSDVNSLDEGTQILDRVLAAVRSPVLACAQVFHVSASIGVSLYPGDTAVPDTLLRHADQAMVLAKQAGKNRYQMFDLEIDRLAQSHLEYLGVMQRALERDEFVLFYQPQVDLGSGEVIGAEALIRWQHPERGLLPPAEFLPHLRGGVQEQVFGEWVIETALTQIETWRKAGLEMKVSVNISANHLLQAEFSERLGQALSRHAAIAPSSLELEVLETAAIGDVQQAVEVLQRCKALGVRFALDDFGTGYSSLTYLRKLPVDTLKIDQSFVRDMLGDADDLSIVLGVIELAGAFHRQVIAEGVETLEHCVLLRSMGCPHAQGYGIARPMAAEKLPVWCQDWLESGAWKRF